MYDLSITIKSRMYRPVALSQNWILQFVYALNCRRWNIKNDHKKPGDIIINGMLLDTSHNCLK